MRHIIQLIPENERRAILENNIINKAVARGGDYYMGYLMIVYKEYIEPGLIVTCDRCYMRVLENFNKFLPVMIELEIESKLLS